jgi:CBS domain-containing protein
MVSEFQTIAADTSVDAADSRLATGFQHDFPVVEDDRVVGMLTRDDLLRWLALQRPPTSVREIMHERFPIAGAHEPLDDVLGRLPTDGSAIAVFQHDQLVGLLDPAHVDQLLAMRGMRPGGLA